MMKSQCIEIYSDVMDCRSSDCLNTGEVINEPLQGYRPRGFFTESTGPVALLVVGKNPGHIFESERKRYIGKNAGDCVNAHLDFSRNAFFCKDIVTGKEKSSTRFHANLLMYLSYILDVPQAQVFELAAYTNLVKCSTRDEQGILPGAVITQCFDRHLVRELKFYLPRIVLALGREVELYMSKAKEKYGFPFEVVYVKHPSRYYNKNILAEVLESLRTSYLKALAP